MKAYNALIDVEQFLSDNSRYFHKNEDMFDYIRTYIGLKFNLDNIKDNKIEIDDLVNVLFRIPRFGGHTVSYYSVGDHLVNCVRLAEANGESQDIVDALILHDCSEAYLGDIPSPIKKRLTEYQKIESEVQEHIYNCFNCPRMDDKIVKFYDMVSLIIEGSLLMNRIDDDFNWSLTTLPDDLNIIDFDYFTYPPDDNIHLFKSILIDIKKRRV